jgi:D-proline reductase (dithiol) PrdB
VGLIARTVEAAGIATVAFSLAKDLTESVGVPRAIFVKWPLGHPLGEPHNVTQQRVMLYHALRLLRSADQPGIIQEPGYRWRRETYHEPDWGDLNR